MMRVGRCIRRSEFVGSAPLSLRVSAKRPVFQRANITTRAALVDYYEALGVSASASDRDIKAAYRKKAKELHPDVNKAPGAEERFMRCKEAYQVLSDADQRAQYDRLRSGRAAYNSRSRTAGGAAGTGYRPGTPGGAYDPFGDIFDAYARRSRGPAAPKEDFYSLDDFLKDLEKDTAEFQKRVRAKRGDRPPASLWEELGELGAAIGEEFVEFLEQSAGISGSGAGPSASASQQQQRKEGQGGQGGSGTGRWYDDVFTGDGSSARGGAGTSSASSAARSQTGAGSSAARPNASTQPPPSSASSSSSSSAQQPRYRPPPGPPKQATEAEVDQMLADLKKKMGLK